MLPLLTGGSRQCKPCGVSIAMTPGTSCIWAACQIQLGSPGRERWGPRLMLVSLSRLHRRGLRKNLLKKLKQLTRLQAQSPGWLSLGFPVTSAGNSCWPTRVRLLRQPAVWPGQGSELRQAGGGHTCLQATTPSLSGHPLILPGRVSSRNDPEELT